MTPEDVWALVPPVACRGLCQESCGPAPALPAEPFHPKINGRTLTCTTLTVDGACGRYSERPLICRLWGAVPAMACPWGCEATLSAEEGATVFLMMKELAPGRSRLEVEVEG